LTVIARALDDVLCRNCAALRIQLDHAAHVATDSVLPDIQPAQSSTRQMLSEVRSVVSSMRTGEQLDLAPILNSLAKHLLSPKISLDLPPCLALADSARTHAVLRCVQEIITNTVKHSGATHLSITIAVVDGTI